jgi:TDG/mug DNA glycosylase family protein
VGLPHRNVTATAVLLLGDYGPATAWPRPARTPEHSGDHGNQRRYPPAMAPRPTPTDLAAARGRQVPDVLAPGLRVLLCGINPGLWSAAVGHHFARPSNRFWKTLHLAGFTDRLLTPAEETDLLRHGLGITNLVDRATTAASDLTPEELRAGAKRLAAKTTQARPEVVAVLGVSAYRTAFVRPKATVGPQPDPIGSATAWLLPNPSGLNAHYQLADLAKAFAQLRRSLPANGPAGAPPDRL